MVLQQIKNIFIVSLCVALAPLSAIQAQDINGKKIPLKPKLTLVGTKTKRSVGDALKGHDVSIIQFWASWCVGCGDVMAQLAKRKKSDSSVGYLSISIDEDMPTAVRYFKSKPAEVTAALPDAFLDEAGEKIASPLKIKSLPVVLIAGEDGTVFQTIAGHPKPDELTSMIAKIRSQKAMK